VARAVTGATAVGYPDVVGEPVPFGNAGSLGSLAGVPLNAAPVGMAVTLTGKGYWQVAADGGIFAFGTAGFYGSAGNVALHAPVVGMAVTPTGRGYWQVAADGGVFTYGTAGFYGSAGNVALHAPVVGMAPTPTGKGYWLVAADGGIFTYGTAGFYGSAGSIRLQAPIVGMAATPTGKGYWLVAADGGIFTYGTAGFYGSAGSISLQAPIVGMAPTPTGRGYWLAAADGGIFTYGAAGYFGSMGGQQLQNPITAMAATPGGGGYWLLPTDQPPALTLGPGATGPAVRALQQRLSSLGYWVGTVNGTFGDSTEQAVWALQKAAGLARNGIVGQATENALLEGVTPHPRSTSGYVIEVDLEDDLLMFVTDGRLEYVLNTSTGGGYTYTATGVTSVAVTPTGQFQIYRQVDGLVVDSLGALWRPKFFTGGYAIHGDSSVPPYPVSHGCVRVSNEAIDWIWADNLLPLGTSVWIY
jgi:hypothetical protein